MRLTAAVPCSGARGFLTSRPAGGSARRLRREMTVTLRRLIAGALAAAMLLPSGWTGAAAADAKNMYKLRGLGAMTCSKYLEDRRTDLAGTESYADWLTGYLTAYNYLTPDTYDIAPQHNASELLTFLDLHCAKNKDQLIGVAASAFTKALHDKRQTLRQ